MSADGTEGTSELAVTVHSGYAFAPCLANVSHRTSEEIDALSARIGVQSPALGSVRKRRPTRGGSMTLQAD